MKKMFLLVLPALLCACSSPRYAYHFDHYDYSEGRKPEVAMRSENDKSVAPQSTENDLLADASKRIILEEPARIMEPPSGDIGAKTYAKKSDDRKIESLSKFSRKERREFIRELKSAIRESKKNTYNTDIAPDEINEMDKDLKFAIIFGAVGLTLSLFTGVNAVFGVLGIIAIVVGVVFLVRWLIRQ